MYHIPWGRRLAGRGIPASANYAATLSAATTSAPTVSPPRCTPRHPAPPPSAPRQAPLPRRDPPGEPPLRGSASPGLYYARARLRGAHPHPAEDERVARNRDHPHEQPDLRALEAALLATTGIPVEQREVQVGGLTLHSLACGEGEPLVLVHGRGLAGALFAPVLRQLAARRRVVTLDLPGWGLSEKPPFTGHSAEDALAWWRGAVLAFLDSEGLDR